MAVWKGAYGPEHRKVALAHNQLAHHYKRIADFDEAIAQFEKAATIWAKLEDPLEGAALYNLGTVYTLKEDYASARMFYERARVLLEQRLDPGHPFVAASLEGLADVALYTGDQATAKSLCERALAIREKAVGPDHHSISFASLRLARVLERSGDWDGARRQLERALSVMQAAFGEDHPETAHVEHQMAGLLQRIGEDEQAFQTGLRATRASIDHSRLIVRALGASQALRFLETRPNGLDLLVSMAMDSRDLTVIRRTWDTVIRSRTLLLDELIKRQRHVIEADGLARMADDLEDARRRLATLIFRGPAGQETEHYRRLVASARRDYDDAERELAAKSASFRQQQGREEFGLAEVLRVLPEGSALVAYSRFERHALDVATESKAATGRSIPAPRSTEPFYVAFLARSAAPSPEVVPLGSADEIDRLIVAWKELASTPPRPLVTPAGKTEGECRVAGDRLRERIWDPVASRLRGERRVFVVAAGQIHLVNLAALPSGADGYLLETGPLLHHLSAERDVVDMRASPKETSMLAIGGVDFGRVTSGDPKTSNPLGLRESSAKGVHRRSPPDCAEPRSIRFGRLPGTAKEVREVAAFWNGPARTLTGTSAGEGTIKKLAPQHGVLHLATHGFFIDDRCPAATELGVVGDNPLLRAGLALAGANNRRQIADQGEDGILTAEEIASLDLSKVRWAVLSACDTGSGHVVNGEGVFGLRRAFEVAGVSTSIMSLWAVDDESTRVWMGELYRAYLEDRLSTAAAVRQASLYVLQGRKVAGRSTHPFHWGGFVAVGDWR